MTEAEIEKIIEEAKTLSLNDVLHDPEISKKFSGLYNAVFPQDPIKCSVCPSVLDAAYKKLIQSIPKRIIMTTNKKWQLKKGVLIDTVFSPIKGVPIHVTSGNCTDDIAEKLIANNPAHEKSFTRLDIEPADPYADAPDAKKKQLETIDATFNNAQLTDILTKKGVDIPKGTSKKALVLLVYEQSQDDPTILVPPTPAPQA